MSYANVVFALNLNMYVFCGWAHQSDRTRPRPEKGVLTYMYIAICSGRLGVQQKPYRLKSLLVIDARAELKLVEVPFLYVFPDRARMRNNAPRKLQLTRIHNLPCILCSIVRAIVHRFLLFVRRLSCT